KRADEIERVSKLLKITDVSSKLIKNLSKGYKQRVGFAQALLGDPKFLILDEPTVGLDPNQVMEVRSIIKDLKKDHSVIFSSHILSEVSAVCDRVIIINKGDIRAIDTIENLERSYSSSLVLRLKIKGARAKASSIIEMTEGVKEIISIDDEGSEIFAFAVQLEGDAETVQAELMSELLKNNVKILEIYTEKPNLENVFIELINRPVKKTSLSDLIDEIVPDSEKAPAEEPAAEEPSAEAEEEKEEN
ncbi:MAG: ATP-binding cassette domain-containing protein, partial [Ruminococcus sp.]|nr:ATP-binding cassette domain-containing protein [Ruminococcus sp.]